MLSNKIYSHFLYELGKYFFLVLFTFSVIVWTVQAVNFLDLIIDDGHGVSVYMNYSLLNIPKILTKFIPLSFLIILAAFDYSIITSIQSLNLLNIHKKSNCE